MEQRHNTVHSRKGKHLTKEERVIIERMSRTGRPVRDIAELLDRHRRTIEREIVSGTVTHKDTALRTHKVYSSDRGQDIHDLNATAKGPELKLGKHYKLVEFIRERILAYKEAPAVVAFRMKEAQMSGAICTKTLYSYIDQGLIKDVTNESLWEKRCRKNRTRRTVRRLRKTPGRRKSIEKRPDVVENRKEFGHWEIDLITGPVKSKAALMTLVERKTRDLIIRKLPDKTQSPVLKAINGLERDYGAVQFRKIFKSITADNGSEFLDVNSLEQSVLSGKERTSLFYAHPYSSWERGTNENTNRIIRRFIAKGRKVEDFTRSTISAIQDWINNYPRKILDFKISQHLFNSELQALSA